MYVTRRWTVMVGVILFATTMHARENAVLRSGFTISHDHRQQLGAVTRLFLSTTDSEYVDVQTERIATFEKEEAPIETQHAASSPLPPSFVGPSSPDLNRIVIEASRKNQLDSDFVHAVIRAESRGNTNAVSRKGAQGLMQLMPGTAAKLGVSFPVLLDTDKKVSKLYDLNTMPSTVVIDRDGKMRFLHRGYRAGTEGDYEQQIRGLLKE